MARGPPAGRPLTAVDRDPGLFGPESVTWRLDREAFLLLGIGPRALLLQIAHPAVAAGVADHSDFRADPWSRLAGTVRSYLRITYGTTAQARAEVRRLNTMHRRVRGSVPGGGTYSARDPGLALWVHATLVDSTIVGAHEWLAPLSPGERARMYQESIPVARAFGIPADRLPPDIDAFEAYLASMMASDGPVHPGPLARELATVILAPRPGPAIRTIAEAVGGVAPAAALEALTSIADRLPPATVGWLLWPSIGLLPPSIRAAYDLRWSPLERAVSAWLVTSWRAWNAVLPPSFRHMSQALAADKRVGDRAVTAAPDAPLSRGPGSAT